MSDENGKLVARGWFLGLGLVAPVCFAVAAGGFFEGQLYKAWIKSHPDEISDYMPDRLDIAKDISVESFRDVRVGKKVSILGEVVNKGDKTVTSITVEAEFFNAKGEFVYEKSDYIRKSMSPGDRENFQITCGCDEKDFPEYKKVTVRVVDASAY